MARTDQLPPPKTTGWIRPWPQPSSYATALILPHRHHRRQPLSSMAITLIPDHHRHHRPPLSVTALISTHRLPSPGITPCLANALRHHRPSPTILTPDTTLIPTHHRYPRSPPLSTPITLIPGHRPHSCPLHPRSPPLSLPITLIPGHRPH